MFLLSFPKAKTWAKDSEGPYKFKINEDLGLQRKVFSLIGLWWASGKSWAVLVGKRRFLTFLSCKDFTQINHSKQNSEKDSIEFKAFCSDAVWLLFR